MTKYQKVIEDVKRTLYTHGATGEEVSHDLVEKLVGSIFEEEKEAPADAPVETPAKPEKPKKRTRKAK